MIVNQMERMKRKMKKKTFEVKEVDQEVKVLEGGWKSGVVRYRRHRRNGDKEGS